MNQVQASVQHFEDMDLQFISYGELDNFVISLWKSYERYIEEMDHPHTIPDAELLLDNEVIKHETYGFPSEVLNHLEEGFLWREFYTNPDLTDDPASDEWWNKGLDDKYRQAMIECWEPIFEEFVQEVTNIFDAHHISYRRMWGNKQTNIPVVEVW